MDSVTVRLRKDTYTTDGYGKAGTEKTVSTAEGRYLVKSNAAEYLEADEKPAPKGKSAKKAPANRMVEDGDIEER